MQKNKALLPKKTQKQRFIEMAKELGEAGETAFNKVLKRVGKAAVPAKPKKTQK